MWWANDSDRNRIPDICAMTCVDDDTGVPKRYLETDHFDDIECYDAHDGDIEYDDMSLQRRDDGPGRLLGILSVEADGCEAFSEEYTFTCPNN